MANEAVKIHGKRTTALVGVTGFGKAKATHPLR
jgi:hypothetical protein